MPPARVVLGPAEDGARRIGPIVLGADGSQAGTIYRPHSERKIEMDGPEVFGTPSPGWAR